MTISAEIPLISIVKKLESLKNGYFRDRRQVYIGHISRLNLDFKEIWIFAKREKVLFQVLTLSLNLIVDLEIMLIYGMAQRNKKINVYRCLHDLRDILTNCYSSFQNYPYKYMKDEFRKPESILFFNQYILFIKYFEEKVDYLIKNRVTSFIQYEFLALPKYTITLDKDILSTSKVLNNENVSITEFLDEELGSISPEKLRERYQSGKTLTSASALLTKFYMHNDSNVNLNIMDSSFPYENEFVTYNRNLAIWPICQKSMLSIYTALSMNMNIIIKGYANTGKTETMSILSNMLAMNYIECETRVHLHADTMISLLSGVISGGYWLMIKNLERCDYTTLSILANYANKIREKIVMKKSRITLGTNQLIIRENYAIFGTFRVMSSSDEAKYNSIPLNLLDNFRTITLVKPNYQSIIEHLLTFVMTNKESRKWANKILLYSKMYKNVENFDYLLKKEERLESARLLKLSTTMNIIDLDLKLISFFIYVAILFYYGKVHEFYTKFD